MLSNIMIIKYQHSCIYNKFSNVTKKPKQIQEVYLLTYKNEFTVTNAVVQHTTDLSKNDSSSESPGGQRLPESTINTETGGKKRQSFTAMTTPTLL